MIQIIEILQFIIYKFNLNNSNNQTYKNEKIITI